DRRSVLLQSQSTAEKPLLAHFEAHLQVRGHIVTRTPSDAAVDCVMYACADQPLTFEQPPSCAHLLYLRTRGTWSKEADGISTIDATDETAWDTALHEALDTLAGIRRPGVLEGIAELPAHYVRDGQLFAVVRKALLESDAGVIGLAGDRGHGRTLLAIDVVRDCEVRRRFPGGIVWFHTEASWPTTVPPLSCLVVADPRREHLPSIEASANQERERGTRVLLLGRSVEDLPVQPTFHVGPRREEELVEIFRAASGVFPLANSMMSVLLRE